MTDNQIITLIKHLDVTDLAGEKVMIDFESGKYFLLKGPANDIWDLIQNPVSYKDILDALLKEYEVEESVCRDSITAFLEQLSGYNFITIA